MVKQITELYAKKSQGSTGLIKSTFKSNIKKTKQKPYPSGMQSLSLQYIINH